MHSTKKSKRVRKQALLEIYIGGTPLEQVVLLSAQLLTEAILGLDYLITYGVEISFPERRITLRVNEEVCATSNSQALKRHQLIGSVTWDL